MTGRDSRWRSVTHDDRLDYSCQVLKFNIFYHCNLKCMIIMLSNIELWNLKFRGKESRGGSSCTTATNLEIMAQPTEQRTEV